MDMPALGSKIKVKTVYNQGPKMIPPQPDHHWYEGTVLPSDKWMKPNQFNLSSTNPNYPIRTIDINYVLEIELIEGSLIKGDNGVQTFIVDGSKGSKYTVTKNKNTWSCSCTGFGFRKTCKHITEVAAKEKSV